MAGKLVIGIMNEMTGELSLDKVSRKVIHGTLQNVPILETLKEHLERKIFPESLVEKASRDPEKEIDLRNEINSFYREMEKISSEEQLKEHVNGFDWHIEWIEV